MEGTTAPWQDFLHRRGITDESIEVFGLGYDQDRDAVAISYRDAQGDLSQIRWRRLGDGHPKYLGAKGQQAELFNVVDSVESPVFLCEGEFDTILLNQLGFRAVGVPGASAWQAAWRWLFLGSEVHIVFDGDEAGRKGALAVARHLNHVAESVVIHDIPDGEDVTSLVLNGELEEVLA